MDDLKQQVIKGYALNQLIGSGGFGAVYKAHQSVIEREVAIKVILPHHANDPHFIRNFESEAQLIARLEHPYIVPLYDFWRDPNGAYLVMRYYPAGNLSQYIHQVGALDEATIARMMEQIGSALDVAHANQIIHRDIKPANILLDTSGNAYLSDFGLAEDISGDEDSADIVGSPAYLPPEIIQNIPPSPQSDLYSLGFVLYEMLTGAYAFAEITPDSSIMSIFDFHLNEVIPDNSMLSDAVNLVIQRATAKDPEDRYPSGLALAHAFREAIEYEGESTTYSIPSEYIINPFKGLRAFDEADEMTFFGRDKLVKRLLQRLDDKSQNENFLALVGPSGSGKSSVVHAGLVPALRRGELEGSDEWFILNMVPSANPFTQLVATLRSISLDPLASAERELQALPDALVDLLPKVIPTQDDHLLLVIDQFEELFTQTTDVTIRKQFLDLLYHSLQSEQFYLVIMLRADFYDRPMLHEGFGELIQARTQVVLPLTSMELTDVITKPALHAGLDMENELTTAIIADVQAEAVSLPLLQYALTEVFEHREQNRLTLEGYEAIGGIAGALAYRADEVYEQLSQEHQALARQIFLRFVTLGEGTEDTRRRVRQTELLSIAPNAVDLQAVLDAFGNARLLTFDNDEQTREPTAEVAHEALIREWILLRDWLDDSRDDIRRQRMLNATVKQWLRANYDASYLLRGTQLIEVEAWRTRSSIILTEDELRFISESQAQRERLVQKEHEAQAEKDRLQKQSTQRLQFLMVGAVVAAIIAIGLSLFAFNQANVAQDAQSTAEFNRQQAEDNQATAIASQRDAELAADAALSNALASAAQQAYALGQEQVALALALDSVNFSPDILNQDGNLATNTLLEISRAPGLIYEETPVDFPISSMIISPDGTFAVFASGLNPSQYWDILGNTPSQSNPPREGAPPSPNGESPPPRGQGNQPPNGAPSQGNPPPPSNQQASQTRTLPSIPNVMYSWDLDTRTATQLFFDVDGLITSMLFVLRADETLGLITMSDTGQVALWDFETQTLLTEWRVAGGYGVLTLADDNRTLFISSNGADGDEAIFMLVNIETGEVVSQTTPRGNLALARMTPNGEHIVGLQLNGMITIYDTATLNEVRSFNINQSMRPSAIDITIHPNSEVFIVNTDSDRLPYYEIATGNKLGDIVPQFPATHRVTFTVDGEQVIAVSREGDISIWNFAGQYFEQAFTSQSTMSTTIAFDAVTGTALVTSNEGDIRAYSIFGDPVDIIGIIGDDDLWDAVWLSDTDVLLSYRKRQPALTILNIETNEETLIESNLLASGQYKLSLSPDQRYAIAQFTPFSPSMVGRYFHIIDLETQQVLDCDFCNRAEEIREQVEVIFASTSPNQIIVGDARRLELYGLDSSKLIWGIEMDATISNVASSPDGPTIAVGFVDGTVSFVDHATGEVIRTITPHDIEGQVNVLEFSPDGQSIGIVELDSEEVVIASVLDGSEVSEFEGHADSVTSLTFLTTQNQVLTTSADSTVMLWDASTGDLIETFAHDFVVFDLALATDESAFISIPEDLLAEVWSLDQVTLEESIAWANSNRVIPELTEADCTVYSISRLCEDDDDESEDEEYDD